MKSFTLGLKKLPFEQDARQIIYVEGQYDEEVNHLIRKNYEAIHTYFEMHGFEFCYMPMLKRDLAKSESVSYYAPSMKNADEGALPDDNFILDYMLHPENREKIPPSLLYYHQKLWNEEYPEAECQFRGKPLTAEILHTDPHLGNILQEIEETINKAMGAWGRFRREIKELVEEEEGDDVRFSLDDEEDEEKPRVDADEKFDVESKKVLNEIREKIEQLKKKGITWYVLKQIIEKDDVQLSRLVITKDNRILLPDYQNKEIHMTPLPKAVFFLFLKHPEGIVFKCLPDYQEELMEFYKRIKGPLFNPQTARRSVEDVTDPFKNSINENCARVRSAFISQFEDHIAHHYYIDGERGEAKTIPLPRDLVEWEE